MATVRTKLQSILDEITEFENWVGNLNDELELKHYYIHMPSLVIPYSIEVRLSSGDSAIAVFDVNYDDVILSGEFTNSLQVEMDRVNALGQIVAFDELLKIKSAFDF
ncbi:MAG: hypothetical protein ACOYMF_05165 [Bacteroidales bacterium]